MSQCRFWIADLICSRILQAAVGSGQGRVISERDRVRGVQIRTDLRTWIDLIAQGAAASQRPADTFVDGERAVMAAQASQGDTAGRANCRVERRARIGCEGRT